MSDPISTQDLTFLDKAVILMVSLELKYPSVSTKIFSSLGEDKSRLVLKKLSSLGKVSPEIVDDVTNEFFDLAISNRVVWGGPHVSSKIIKDSFGVDSQSEFFCEKESFFSFLAVFKLCLLDGLYLIPWSHYLGGYLEIFYTKNHL